jgi:putative addiction module component (TIGR02574 family)
LRTTFSKARIIRVSPSNPASFGACKSSPANYVSARVKTEFAPLFKLGRAERLELVEDLWDSIAAEDAALPVSDEKRAELHRRKEHFQQHPNSGRTWAEVKSHARAK